MKWEKGNEGLTVGDAWELVTKLGSKQFQSEILKKKSIPEDIAVKLQNNKDNMKILKGAREKHNIKGRTTEVTVAWPTTAVSTKLGNTLAMCQEAPSVNLGLKPSESKGGHFYSDQKNGKCLTTHPH